MWTSGRLDELGGRIVHRYLVPKHVTGGCRAQCQRQYEVLVEVWPKQDQSDVQISISIVPPESIPQLHNFIL